MRSPVLITFLFVACLATAVYAWSKEDHEIFRLRDEVEIYEGEGTTFYDFVGVKNGVSSTIDDISKAYKKQSIRLHPDKHKPKPAPGSTKKLTKSQIRDSKKLASERFSRLALVRTILSGPLRERYDHFLKNGFPRWRGTGYYYARFRPGITTVLVGLFVFCGGGMHYAILLLNSRQQRAFMERYIKHARTAAWGEAGVPGLADIQAHQAAVAEAAEKEAEKEPPMNRAQRRLNKPKKVGAGTSTPAPGPNGAGKRRVVAENGKILIVDSAGDVFLDGKDEDGKDVQYPLNLDDIEGPKLRNTFLVRLPLWAFMITVGRFLPAKKVVEESSDSDDDDDSSESGSASGSARETRSKKKGVAKKVESRGDGVPRRKVTQRPAKKQK